MILDFIMKTIFLLIGMFLFLHNDAEGAKTRRHRKDPYATRISKAIESYKSGKIDVALFQVNFWDTVYNISRNNDLTEERKCHKIINLISLASKKEVSIGFHNYAWMIEILQENGYQGFEEYFLFMIKERLDIRSIKHLIDQKNLDLRYEDLFLMYLKDFMDNQSLFEMSFPLVEVPEAGSVN